jgi:hypothetical protein
MVTDLKNIAPSDSSFMSYFSTTRCLATGTRFFSCRIVMSQQIVRAPVPAGFGATKRRDTNWRLWAAISAQWRTVPI